MSLGRYFRAGRFGLSFELFPPKTEVGETAMYKAVAELMKYKPDFVTCTYGAGGSTQNKTLDICQQVHNRFKVPVASHLTVVGSTQEELAVYLNDAVNRGVENIVALRGDPPKGDATFTPKPGGFRYANELVGFIKERFPNLGIAVAGYPEKHLEAPSLQADLVNLKRKVDAGADTIVTQLFYQNEDFFRFQERCDKIGIRIPIVPGILPVTDLAQIQRITSLCGAKLPDSFVSRLSEKTDPEWQFEVGVEFAIRQIQDLIAHGIPGLHFYVLNKSQATTKLLEAIQPPRA